MSGASSRWAAVAAIGALLLGVDWFMEFSAAFADGTTPQWLGWDDFAPALLLFFAAGRAAGGTVAEALGRALFYGALIPVCHRPPIVGVRRPVCDEPVHGWVLDEHRWQPMEVEDLAF